MPRVAVPRSSTPRRAQPVEKYDPCEHVTADDCGAYRYLSIEWSDCRRRTWDSIHEQCVRLSYEADFEIGEKRRCMKARGRAFCRLEDHYEIIRH